MSRPEYLNCPMTPEIIRDIRERQEAYDQNPEQAERDAQEYELQRQEQEQRDYEQYQMMIMAEQDAINMAMCEDGQ